MYVIKLEEVVENIDKYINRSREEGKAILINVNNKEDYKKILSAVELRMLRSMRMSSYCREDKIAGDGLPDMDIFLESLGEDAGDKVVIGVSEYRNIRRGQKEDNYISKIANMEVKGVRIVILYKEKKKILNLLTDKRLEERIILVESELKKETNIKYYYEKEGNELTRKSGFKNFLIDLENKNKDEYEVYTTVDKIFINSNLSHIKIYNSDFDKVKEYIKEGVELEDGTDKNWTYLKNKLEECKYIERVIEREFEDFEKGYREWDTYTEEKKWLYVIGIKAIGIKNNYVMEVAKATTGMEGFVDGLYSYLEDKYIENDDIEKLKSEQFKKESEQRKEVIKYINMDSEKYIEDYCKITKYKTNDIRKMYYLTGLTDVEKKEMIVCLGEVEEKYKNDAIEIIKNSYEDLYKYMKDYNFKKETRFLNEYFKEYKKVKLEGKISEKHNELVEKYAEDRKEIYSIETRVSKFEKVVKSSDYVYWVDCLGVEYLEYVLNIASEMKIDVEVSVVKSELPTITKLNKEFIETCEINNISYEKKEELDKIKHRTKNPYENSNNKKYPIYLTEELEIIKKIIKETKNKLKQYEKVVWVSDHGSSRGVILKEEKEKYELEGRGLSGGRYCECVDGIEEHIPEDVVEDKGNYVITNYNKFRGGREEGNELHGGGTLEELIVPILEFRLRENKEEIKIKLVNDKIVYSKIKDVILKIKVTREIKNLEIKIDDKYFEKIDEYKNNTYEVKINDIKKKEQNHKYKLIIKEGNHVIGKMEFMLESAGMKVRDDF